MARLVLWLVVLLCAGQQVLAEYEYEYEYYYEEVSESSTDPPETTTVAAAPEEQTIIEASTASPSTDVISITNIEDSDPNVDHSVTAVSGTATPLAVGEERTNFSLSSRTRITPRPAGRPSGPPGIILNIYTGMYGMPSQGGSNRPSGKLGGWNSFWTRTQSPLQGWYDLNAMASRRPTQSFVRPNQRRPIYRGRGPVYEYNDGYYTITNQRATMPTRRNNQPSRNGALDQQASMAVFNFLLQALGQQSSSGRRSQQQQRQPPSRRRV